MRHPDFDLTGRVALVTGAARGIGLAIVFALASAGCGVAIQDLDLTEAKKRSREINDAGGREIALGGDVEGPAIAGKLVRDTVRALGGVHIIPNNASVQSRQPWSK